MADLLAGMSSEPETPSSAFKGTTKQAIGGLYESVPLVGEKLAETAKIPEPTTFKERLTRRAARNLPYALAAGPFTGGIPAAIGYVGSVGLGQLAEEVGVPKEYQPVAEVAGGGAAQAGREIAGRTLGYIEPRLEKIYTKAKNLYELGPSARSAQGMKYGAGETPTSSLRNLDKFTEEATARAGNKINRKAGEAVDANWINKTQEQLGNEVGALFAGKTFTSTPKYQQDIAKIVDDAEGIFGQQGNVAKTIIEKNIGGQRAGGTLLSPQFKAEDLRGAITQVNAALSGAKGPQAKVLHDLKDALEDLAQSNLPKDLAKQYADWRKKYNSFSTLRDLIQIEGTQGVTSSGQVNPRKLLDIVTNRTGGDATRSPLFENLAEFGDILKVKELGKPNVATAAMRVLSESKLGKALGTALQPRLPSLAGEYAATAQTLSPTVQYTQGMLPQSMEEKRKASEFSEKIFGRKQ